MRPYYELFLEECGVPDGQTQANICWNFLEWMVKTHPEAIEDIRTKEKI